MSTLVDDVGSFPLPSSMDRQSFSRAYALVREAIAKGKDVRKDEFLLNNFVNVVIDSFEKKCETGLDVVNYPQHYDMHEQFMDVIHKAMDKGTYVVEEKEAIIPEVHVINEEAKRLYEKTGKKVSLRVSITGPMDLYLREIGTKPYVDILLMLAETVKRFAKNSILNSKYAKTEVVSIDEPSFGFHDITADRNTILDVLERTFNFNGAVKQIHLHSPSRGAELLEVKNLNVLSFEYAASPKNIEGISKSMLQKSDKQIRVGISRTDINSILAELYEKGITKPQTKQLVESEETIRKRFVFAKEKYGDRMTFTGPDCGLGGWPTQEAVQLLLKRTVNAVKSARINT
jgi:5-methyltetrahydropteroyltriglutamate--homocysteine methyltransferase